MRIVGRALIVALCASACACSPPSSPTSGVSEATPSALAESGAMVVTAPVANARVTSPVRVTGVAPNDWYFEAVFPAQLLSADGTVLAEAPAQAQTDWTTPGPVPFVAEFTIAITKDQNATIVLSEDDTGEKPHRREVRIPVVLTAGK